MIHDKQTHRDITARLDELQKVIARSSKLSDDLQDVLGCAPEGPILDTIGRLEDAYITSVAELIQCDASMLQDWCYEHEFGGKSMSVWGAGNNTLDPDWEIGSNAELAEFIRCAVKPRPSDLSRSDL